MTARGTMRRAALLALAAAAYGLPSAPAGGLQPLGKLQAGARVQTLAARSAGRMAGLRGGGAAVAPGRKREAEAGKAPAKSKGSLVRVIFVGWMYFLSVALAVPALPKLVNNIMGGKDTVSPRSQMALASLMATDGFFTFLTNNLWGAMSDKYGRKPFMAMSATGIATGAAMIYSSTSLWPMYLGAVIDGCTSCMFGLGQAYTSDISSVKELPENIGVFMGVAAGCAFMFGIPVSTLLTAKVSPRAPFLASAIIGALNVLFITFVLPESTSPNTLRHVTLEEANPWGALQMLRRNRLISGVSTAYFLLWFAHTGLQATWMNFFERAHGWNAAKAGAVLSVFGIGITIFPKMVLRVLTLTKAVEYSLLMYAVAMVGLAVAKGDRAIYMVLVLACLGSTSLPSTLSFLAHQAGPSEKGAMQGATETLKTLCTITAGPVMSAIFAYWISGARMTQRPGAMFMVASVLLAGAYTVFKLTITADNALKEEEARRRKERHGLRFPCLGGGRQ